MIDRIPLAQPPIPDARKQLESKGKAPFNSWIESTAQEDPATVKHAEPLTLAGPVLEKDEAVIVELHIGGGRGEPEVVSVPWRLAAGNSLSHSWGAVTVSTADWLTINAPATCPTSRSAVMPFHTEEGTSPLLPDRASHGLLAVLPAEQRTKAQSEAEPSLPVSSSSAVLAEQWSARLMRWIHQHGRNPAVWVRDYSLSDEAAGGIVNDLKTFAQEQGKTLERIVINGRELWRNGHHARQESHSCP